MKAIILGLSLLFNASIFAAKVPQAELDNVNQYISTLMGDFGQMVQIEFTDVERSDVDAQLSASTVRANILGIATLDLGLKTKEKSIVLSGAVEGSASQLGLTINDVLDLAVEAKKFVDNINAKGDYVATFNMGGVAGGTTLAITMVPSATNTNPSINNFEVNGFLPNAADEMAKVSVSGELNGGADNVKIVRTAVTNIFNNLAAGQLPEEKDFDALLKVIDEMFDAIQEFEQEI